MANTRFVTARFNQTPTGYSTSYYHTDVIGSVRAITDAVGATVIRHDYAPFGEENAAMTGDPLRFAGKELDPETGLNYFAARYYRNTWGRFSQVDPVSGWTTDPQSWNRYAYARNNPLKYVDPKGLRYEVSVGGCGWSRYKFSCEIEGDANIEDSQWEDWKAYNGFIAFGGDIYHGGDRVGSYRYVEEFAEPGANTGDGIADDGGGEDGEGAGGLRYPLADRFMADCLKAMNRELCALLLQASLPSVGIGHKLPQGKSLAEFAAMMGWKQGGTAAANIKEMMAWMARASKEGVDRLRQQWLTEEILEYWHGVYAKAISLSKDNPNAVSRLLQIDALLEMFKPK